MEDDSGDELMQIKHLPAPEECPAWLVTLDCDEERRLSELELIRLLENCEGISWNDEAQRYALNGSGDFGPEVDCHYAIRRNGDVVNVSIYLS